MELHSSLMQRTIGVNGVELVETVYYSNKFIQHHPKVTTCYDLKTMRCNNGTL